VLIGDRHCLPRVAVAGEHVPGDRIALLSFMLGSTTSLAESEMQWLLQGATLCSIGPTSFGRSAAATLHRHIG
jgi:hypothetical protein